MKPKMVKPDKIEGYYRYEVEDGGRTLKRAEEIKADKKFLAVVLKNMGKEADELDKTAALVRSTKEKLGKVFGGK